MEPEISEQSLHEMGGSSNKLPLFSGSFSMSVVAIRENDVLITPFIMDINGKCKRSFELVVANCHNSPR